MRAAKCTVLSESLLSWGKQPSFKPRHKGFRLDLTQVSSQISLDIYSGAIHSPFSLFYTIKALNGKLTVLGDFFSLHIQSWIEPHKDFFIRADGSVYINVSYQWESTRTYAIRKPNTWVQALTLVVHTPYVSCSSLAAVIRLHKIAQKSQWKWTYLLLRQPCDPVKSHNAVRLPHETQEYIVVKISHIVLYSSAISNNRISNIFFD